MDSDDSSVSSFLSSEIRGKSKDAEKHSDRLLLAKLKNKKEKLQTRMRKRKQRIREQIEQLREEEAEYKETKNEIKRLKRKLGDD